MEKLFIQYIFLILIILGLVMIANKLRLAYSIVLVIGGLALSFTSRFSNVTINPDMVFFIFLPPLLYEAAWQVSWKEFWKWRRIITSFAFPIVIITSIVIAFVSNALIPGFTLALGFLLGGIIAPPDAVSATAVMRQVEIPKGLMEIAEGESLLNDASALIIFRFALAAVITGQFRFEEAIFNFLLVIFMGILMGLFIGLIFYCIHRWLPTTTSIEIILTLVTPYCMYYFAEHFHFSGVLAVVSGGLFLSNMRHRILTYQSRIQGTNVWGNLIFVLNGLIFLLIGLELSIITKQLEDVSLGKAIGYGLIISLALMITRLLCTLGASVFTRFVSRFITVADPNPGWKMPFIFGWAGMRGVVSLAAALSIPLVISEGHSFPYRNLILFVTFIVILVTLVFQGLTLPWVIRKINPRDKYASISKEEQELIIRKEIAQRSLQFLEEKYGEDIELNEHAHNLYLKLKIDLNFFDPESEDAEDKKGDKLRHYQSTYLELLEQQRRLLKDINKRPEFDEELLRKYFVLIDLEEFKLREKLV